MTLWTWLGAARRFAFNPNQTYRQLTLGGSSLPPRVYLGMIVLMVAVGWGIVRKAAQLDGVLFWSIIAGSTVVMMTYIEALGVTYFSKRKGWRVPWPDAERVACYASIGWVPAAAILAKVRLIQDTHALTGSWPRWWPQAWLPDGLGSGTAADVVTLGIVGSVAILGFEWLVWFGVKRIRFGNRRITTSSPIPAPEPGDRRPTL